MYLPSSPWPTSFETDLHKVDGMAVGLNIMMLYAFEAVQFSAHIYRHIIVTALNTYSWVVYFNAVHLDDTPLLLIIALSMSTH